MQIQMDRESATALIQQRISEGEQLARIVNRHSDTDGWAHKLEHSLGRLLGDNPEWIGKFRHRHGIAVPGNPERNADLAKENVAKTLSKLISLLDIISESDEPGLDELNAASAEMQITNRVFLVHGRADAQKNEVARFLDKAGLDVVILHERPNRGRTLITKFQEESADASFAVILVTPDDIGGLVDGEAQPRARQNVVFELGFFIGRLGSERVCALITAGVERPSDFDGVVYVPFDPNGGWRTELMRELAAVRIPVDFAKAFAS